MPTSMMAANRAARRQAMALIATAYSQIFLFDLASSVINTDHNADRAVIDNTSLTHTPIDIIAFTREINRFVTLIAVAEAALAGGFATAVIVRNDIVFVVGWIEAGANPGDR